MDLSRRGILKLFGAGAAIVPVAAGVPILEARATLIEQPRIDIVPAAIIPSPQDARELQNQYAVLTVTLEDQHGKRYQFVDAAFVMGTSRRAESSGPSPVQYGDQFCITGRLMACFDTPHEDIARRERYDTSRKPYGLSYGGLSEGNRGIISEDDGEDD